MIGWLEGQRLDNWHQALKQGIVLACSGVGYEVQLLPRHLALIGSVEKLTLWIHQVKRDDGESLYGFQIKNERDIFRILLGVTGVGPQMAMALLEEAQVDELISAILNGNSQRLSQAHGVGKRTAERLSIELRHKLSDLNNTTENDSTNENKIINELPFQSSIIIELHETLKGLGYEDFEINKAIHAVANESQSVESSKSSELPTTFENAEGLLKAILLWLSNESKL